MSSKDKHAALSVPRPGDTLGSLVFPVLQKYKRKKKPEKPNTERPQTSQHPFLFTNQAADNQMFLTQSLGGVYFRKAG